MSGKLYDLMNWPDIEGVVYSECDNPKALLGGHMCAEGYLIQVFRPDAVEVSVIMSNRKKYSMEKVDEGGFFAVLVPGKKAVSYKVVVEDIKGRKETYIDPYAFSVQYNQNDFKNFKYGKCVEAWKLFGSHEVCINDVAGTLFTVWAPNATRVSVVGAFNHWDGRLHMMEKIEGTGVFELFIPGLEAGTEYNYEVKEKSGRVLVKLDPYALCINSDFSSVVCHDMEYQWSDTQWMRERAEKQSVNAPISVYEVNIEAWEKGMGMKGANYRNLAESICDYVKKTAYTHIELMPVAEYQRSYMMGYGTVGYFAPTARFGSPEDFKAFVEVFHKAGIGVLMDWNAAFFSDDSIGLERFDGTDLYGSLRPVIEKNSQWKVTTFAYEKPEVRNFLYSSLKFWLEMYHLDGVRVDSVASMLYLDYGKGPGQWQPNLYGGPQNLEGESFLKNAAKLVHKNFAGAILIAEENSGWSGVTTSGGEMDEEQCLGFDYKWDYNWKNDFLSFINHDPLFRKGEYGKLTYAMLYHYNESYMLHLSHDEFTEDKCSLFEMVSGENASMKLADIRSVYGFLYTHPGRKLLCMGQDIGLPNTWSITNAIDRKEMEKEEYQQMMRYIGDLNQLYRKHPALYEQDDLSDGFEWLDSVSVEETVIAYVRRDDSGKELTIVINFTPVTREGFRLGVTKPGKYTEIFNSDYTVYGGSTMPESKLNVSSDIACFGRDDSICITLPASSVIVMEYEPYSEVELQEMAIKKQARIAKEQAEAEARIAKELKEKAEEEARMAIEAEKKAKAAAAAALKAKQEADRKAAAAEKASLRIDAETKKKLEALKK